MPTELESIDDLVLRGATIEQAIDRRGLRDAWNEGACLALRGQAIRRHFDFRAPTNTGWVRLREVSHSRHGGLAVQLRDSGVMADEFHERFYWSDEQRARHALRPEVIEWSRKTGLTLQNLNEKVFFWVCAAVSDAQFAYHAAEGRLRFVPSDDACSFRTDGNAALWVEERSRTDIVIHVSPAEAPEPSFRACVIQLQWGDEAGASRYVKEALAPALERFQRA